MFASSSVFSEANSLHTSSIKLSGFFKRSEGLELCLNPDENHFRIISSAATRERDKHHIKKHLNKDSILAVSYVEKF